MADTLRGKAAVVGIGQLKPQMEYPGRDETSLLSEAAFMAIQDAGLRKQDIDGFIMIQNDPMSGFQQRIAEHIGIQPTWATGNDTMGAASVTALAQAAAYVQAGLANYVLVATARSQPQRGGGGPVRTDTASSEFSAIFGPTQAANGSYALKAKRHEFLYGTTVEKRAKIAVDQRYNANHNPMAIFHDTPITRDDVVNSRMIADPLHLLECVMPVCGGAAYVVTRADIARSLRHKPAYILGGGLWMPRANLTHVGEITIAPAGRGAQKAFAMAGYGTKDIQYMEVYDSYTITVLCELEDAGFCKKGEGGDWINEQDFTFKGNLPMNTHGGQMSFGQPTYAGGCSMVIEAVTQMRRDGGDHQIVGPTDLAFLTGSGGTFSVQSAAVLGSAATL